MVKIHSFFSDNFKILAPMVLVISCFGIAFFVVTFDRVGANEG